MKKMDLTPADYRFAEVVKLRVQSWMQPVPFLILSPSALHEENRLVVVSTIEQMLADENFKITLAKDGIPVQKLEYILKGISSFELWKRGWMMRGQWILQVLALIVLWNIIWMM